MKLEPDEQWADYDEDTTVYRQMPMWEDDKDRTIRFWAIVTIMAGLIILCGSAVLYLM